MGYLTVKVIKRRDKSFFFFKSYFLLLFGIEFPFLYTKFVIFFNVETTIQQTYSDRTKFYFDRIQLNYENLSVFYIK